MKFKKGKMLSDMCLLGRHYGVNIVICLQKEDLTHSSFCLGDEYSYQNDTHLAVVYDTDWYDAEVKRTKPKDGHSDAERTGNSKQLPPNGSANGLATARE